MARYTRRTFRDLVSLGMAPILFIGLVAPAAFAFIFGEQWRDAGTYCLWLSPWLFFVFVSSPLSRLVFVVNQQSGELIFQGTLLLARVLSLSVGAAIGGAMTALRIYGVVSALCWMFYSLWLLRIAGSNFRSTVSVLLHEGGVVAVILVPMLVVQTLSNGSVKLVALLAVLTGAVVLGRVAIVVRKMSFDQPSHMGD